MQTTHSRISLGKIGCIVISYYKAMLGGGGGGEGGKGGKGVLSDNDCMQGHNDVRCVLWLELTRPLNSVVGVQPVKTGSRQTGSRPHDTVVVSPHSELAT